MQKHWCKVNILDIKSDKFQHILHKYLISLSKKSNKKCVNSQIGLQNSSIKDNKIKLKTLKTNLKCHSKPWEVTKRHNINDQFRNIRKLNSLLIAHQY